MKLYEVSLKPEFEELYSCPLDHHFFGYKWQEDDEHIWFKAFKTDYFLHPFVSSPVRFLKTDVNYKELIINDVMKEI